MYAIRSYYASGVSLARDREKGLTLHIGDEKFYLSSNGNSENLSSSVFFFDRDDLTLNMMKSFPALGRNQQLAIPTLLMDNKDQLALVVSYPNNLYGIVDNKTPAGLPLLFIGRSDSRDFIVKTLNKDLHVNFEEIKKLAEA